MKYILDIAVAAAVVICVAAGRSRGAVRTLIYLAGLAAAFAAAVFVSSVSSEYVYEKAVRPAVISAMESKAEELEEEYLSSENAAKLFSEYGIDLTEEQLRAFAENKEICAEVLTDGEFRAKLNHMFTEYCKALTETFSGVIPDEIEAEAERYIKETDIKNDRTIQLFNEENLSVTDIIEREIVRPVMLKTVRTVLFALTFALVMLAVSLISRAAGLIRKISALRSADGFLGGILGFLQSLLLIAVMCAGTDVFIKLTSDSNSYLNSDIIAETYIFKRLYSGVLMLAALILK